MRPTVAAIVSTGLLLVACETTPSHVAMPTAGHEAEHHEVHWAYEGEGRPANWGKLDEKFLMCSIGRNQSPVDIAAPVKAELAPLRFEYAAGALSIQNNGHTVQVDYAPGSTLIVDGKAFPSRNSTSTHQAKTRSAANGLRWRRTSSMPIRTGTWPS